MAANTRGSVIPAARSRSTMAARSSSACTGSPPLGIVTASSRRRVLAGGTRLEEVLGLVVRGGPRLGPTWLPAEPQRDAAAREEHEGDGEPDHATPVGWMLWRCAVVGYQDGPSSNT